jgi:ABC-type bacteriocin/lantibiotic exporter with double-glycine peptidase domain
VNIFQNMTTGSDPAGTGAVVPGPKTLLRAMELALGGVPGTPPTSMARIARRLRRGADPAEIARTLCDATPTTARSGVASAAEILEAARSGGVSVIAQAPAGWLVASPRAGRSPHVVSVAGVLEEQLAATPRALQEVLGDGAVPVIIVEPRLGLESLSARLAGSGNPWQRLRALLVLERADLVALLVYALVLGGLSLAVPLSVQVLVTTIAFGSLLQPLIVLSALLFGVLAFSGVIQVLQMYAAEVLQRRMFVRVAEDFARRLPALRLEVHDETHVPELSTRFFEVVGLQKSLSLLLVEGVGLCLQTFVAMLLMAFYHPFLLAFDVALIVALLLVFAAGYGAVSTAVAESRAKYQVAAWLQQVASQPALFGRGSARVAAAVTADGLTRDYLAARKRHYGRILRQLVGGVGVQVLAMVVLLGIGGWLVMNGELTLGQLVAAELVVGVIGVGFGKAGKHLETLYDLVAGLEKLGKVIDQPVAPDDVGSSPAGVSLAVALRGVRVSKAGAVPTAALDLHIPAGARVLLRGRGGTGKSALLESLAGLRSLAAGTIRAEGVTTDGRASDSLRERAWLLLPSATVEGSILDNLRLGGLDIDEEQAWELLQSVELDERVADLVHGLHTRLLPSGSPLSSSEVARLCLARAMAASPGLLLVDGALDDLGLGPTETDDLLQTVLGPDAPWTVVVVSNRQDVERRCDMTIEMGHRGQEPAE